MFERSKSTPSCLSTWQCHGLCTGQLDAGLLARLESHVRDCVACERQVGVHREAMRDAQNEAVPEALHRAVLQPDDASELEAAPAVHRGAAGTTRAFWSWSRAGGGLAACASAMAAWLIWQPSVVERTTLEQDGAAQTRPTLAPRGGRLEGTRAKGAVQLELSLVRDGETLRDTVLAKDLGPWKTGDKLQLRLAGAQGHYARLEGLDKGAWALYFEDRVPSDGWLPIALELTRDGQTRMRALVCETQASLRVAAEQSKRGAQDAAEAGRLPPSVRDICVLEILDLSDVH